MEPAAGLGAVGGTGVDDLVEGFGFQVGVDPGAGFMLLVRDSRAQCPDPMGNICPVPRVPRRVDAGPTAPDIVLSQPID